MEIPSYIYLLAFLTLSVRGIVFIYFHFLFFFFFFLVFILRYWFKVFSSHTENCPPHLSKSNLHTYGHICIKVHYGNYDWIKARQGCKNEGGDLVQVRDSGIQQFLRNILRGQRSEVDGFWIGASDKDSESHWKWVAGKK